jgi:hypothetical protein
MQMRSVRVLLAALATAHSGLHAQGAAQTSRRYSVVGVVAQESGVPIPEAEVWLVVADTRVSAARSGENGHFLVAADVNGPSRLMIRRLGYRARQVPLEFPRDTINALLIMLEATPQRLPSVDVAADGDEIGDWLRDFNERRKANRFGRFFTRDAIRKSGKQQASELLRTTPGVSLTAARRFGNVVRMRGCAFAPLIWLDGIRLPHTEFDEVAKPEDIAGLEVYTSTAGVPAEFTDRSNSGCGTIVIWTRHR